LKKILVRQGKYKNDTIERGVLGGFSQGAVLVSLLVVRVNRRLLVIGAATILPMGLGYDSIFIMCALASLTAFCIYLSMYLKLRKIIPALADAS
jgi:hypothetical protein